MTKQDKNLADNNWIAQQADSAKQYAKLLPSLNQNNGQYDSFQRTFGAHTHCWPEQTALQARKFLPQHIHAGRVRGLATKMFKYYEHNRVLYYEN